jgi:hypothetical protein
MDDLREKIRCKYIDVCYMADGLQCYGYKSDCVLYRKSNNETVTTADFHRAFDELIRRTKAKHGDSW